MLTDDELRDKLRGVEVHPVGYWATRGQQVYDWDTAAARTWHWDDAHHVVRAEYWLEPTVSPRDVLAMVRQVEGTGGRVYVAEVDHWATLVELAGN